MSLLRRWIVGATATLLTAVLVGCGSQSAASPAITPTDPAQSAQGAQAAVASTDLAVGRNRFTFGIIENDKPLAGGHPHLDFFYLDKNSATKAMSTTASFSNFAQGLKNNAANAAAVQIKGVYVAHPTFTRAGVWGAQIRLRYHGRTLTLNPEFLVKPRSTTPAVGSPAPRSHNPTTAQEPATLLDSGRPPDDMHKLSIAQAIAEHRPLVVLFATAAYCTSRLCGPEIEQVETLEREFKPRGVNFVHIEIYKDANPKYGTAPTFEQWHLKTEPWVFVINRQGIITAKFEGPSPAREVAPAIAATLH